MGSVSKYTYYGRSVWTLLTQFEDPVRTVEIFLNRPGKLPAVVQLRGTGWRFHVRTPMDIWVLKETCIDLDYSWGVGQFGPDWSIVDIGAGLGDFTVFAAMSCPQGTVHAYEPLPESHALLRKNVVMNGVTNVRPVGAAVASRSGAMSIESEAVEPVTVRTTQGSSGEIAVPAVTLGDAIDALPDGRCDYMKIDCEGGEFDILMDSSADDVRRIDRISVEVHEGVTGYGIDDLQPYLESLDFKVRRRKNPVHDYLGFLYAELSPAEKPPALEG